MKAENKSLRELHNESNPICDEKKVHKDDKKAQMQKMIDKLSEENSKLLQEQNKNKMEISKLRQEHSHDDKDDNKQKTIDKLLQEQNKNKKEISKLRQDQKKKAVKVSQKQGKCCTTKCCCALFMLYVGVFLVLPIFSTAYWGEFSDSN